MRSAFTLTLACLAGTVSAQVVAYPAAPYSQASAEIVSLKAAGVDVPVERFQNYQFARFAVGTAAECEVTVNEAIDSAAIRPRIRNVLPRISGNKLRFTVQPLPGRPAYLLIKINRLGWLAILADSPETDTPDPLGAGTRLIGKAPYAADAIDASDATAAIQKALDDASAAGGGLVYVPAGVFRVVKTLQARSGVSLYLAPGATLRASPVRSDYAVAGNPGPMLETVNVSDFRVFGRGTMDASGMALMIREGTLNRRRLMSGAGKNRNISVEGVTLRDATTWTLVIQGADSCLVRNVKILNHWDQADVKIQNDGIDLCSTRHGTAAGNFVMTGDDAMCAKGNGSETAWLTFRDNVLFTFAAGCKAGMQSSGAVHDIDFIGNAVVACRRGMAVETLEGALPISRIRFSGTTIDGYHSLPGWKQWAIEMLAEQAPIADISIDGAYSAEPKASHLDGLDHGIKGVQLKGLWLGDTPVLSATQGSVTLANATEVTFAAGPSPVAVARPARRTEALPAAVPGVRASGGVVATGARDQGRSTRIRWVFPQAPRR